MQTECTSAELEFEGLGRRRVVGRFDGGRMTSDGGALLLREADRVFNVTGRLAACFVDHRDPGRVEHGLRTLVAQRVMSLALGYEDLNDHDRLRKDAVLALASGCEDVTGEGRIRERDRDHPLAASSTLNRLELGTPERAATDRYRRIVADPGAIDRLLVDLFLETHAAPPREIILDIDATDDPVHGRQEGRFFHGYYGHHCYLPLYITCGEHVLCCRLRPADIDASHGSVDELMRIVPQIRAAWPHTRIILRGDSGFCREAIMGWCEEEGVDHVLGSGPQSAAVQAHRQGVAQVPAPLGGHGASVPAVPGVPLPHQGVMEPLAPGRGQGGVASGPAWRQSPFRGDLAAEGKARCPGPV